MTKKLEDLLNLPNSKQIVEESRKEKKETAIVEQEDTMRSIQELDKIQAALPQVKGLGDLGDTELDEVATKSMDAYEDLMDLGMNVESRYSGRIFEVAGQMLKTNLDIEIPANGLKKQKDLQLKFYNWINALDKVRGTSVLSIRPEFESWFREIESWEK